VDPVQPLLADVPALAPPDFIQVEPRLAPLNSTSMNINGVLIGWTASLLRRARECLVVYTNGRFIAENEDIREGHI
jgi:hypothetical protein